MSSLKVPVSEKDHRQGGDNNPDYTLVEYGDYECPHCRVAHPMVKRLERHFGDRLMFVFRNFPLTQIHPFAEAAAETAEFAAEHGVFWEMHDLLFQNQDRLGLPLLQELASKLGLDSNQLTLDLEQGTYKPRIRADFTSGVLSGVNGTPTFFINGQRHNGPNEYSFLIEKLEKTSH